MHRCKRSSRGGTQHPARPLARWHGSRDIDLLASAHINLEMFDRARSTLKEALNFTRRCDDKESAQMASCHQNMAFICQQQVYAIKGQVGMHMNYMLTNSMAVYHSQVSRVLVEGLQKNQIEGVVMKTDGPRMRIRLDTHDNKELMLKPENVCPLFPKALKLQEQLLKLHNLAQERITSNKEARRFQIKARGVKHVNTTIACQNLGTAYLSTGKPAYTGLVTGLEATLLIQADRIRRGVGDDDTDQAFSMSRSLCEAQAAQA